ncbi:general secretion pathway protein GspB [Pleionea sp. CnH1-48]|uniref:general secretion pathway protein GspB n=1 Tax=Pleionea sp. CnH1-48 TaxID=2954494 RepID=UPI002096FD51|nr:general secretion pathway protein GspB [Pleionea sp. CnH1-48]MCO7225627.1 general secretion pathway protein GspB [Pleionea sp. CnH1-48]
MSIILNALNKDNHEAQDSEFGHDIASEIDESVITKDESFSSNDKTLYFLLTVIALLLLVIVVFMAIDKFSQPATVVEPVRSEPVSQTPQTNEQARTVTPPTLESRSEESQSSSSSPYFESYAAEKSVVKPQQNVKRAVVPRKTVSSQVVKDPAPTPVSEPVELEAPAQPEIAGDIISFDDLSAQQKLSMASVRIDAHVYSENPGKSFIFYAGKLKQNGDLLADGWVLSAIEEDAIIVSNGILIVRKKVNQN